MALHASILANVSVADPEDFCPYPDPTSRSGSGSEFSPNFLLFFIFLLFYSEFLNLTLFCRVYSAQADDVQMFGASYRVK